MESGVRPDPDDPLSDGDERADGDFPSSDDDELGVNAGHNDSGPDAGSEAEFLRDAALEEDGWSSSAVLSSDASDDDDDDDGVVPLPDPSVKPTLCVSTAQRAVWGSAAGYVILDLEHSGGKRPSIIQIAALWADADGKYDKATAFKELVHTSKPINSHVQKVHHITAEMLKGKDGFALVGARFVEWIEQRARTAGTSRARVLGLVAHNGFTCDFRYLAIELAAANLALPAAKWLCLDTLAILRKLPRLALHAATPVEISARQKITKKEAEAGKTFGKPALGLESVVNYLLPAGSTFISFCGPAHDALSDTVGCAVVLTSDGGAWTGRGKKLALAWRVFAEYGARSAAFFAFESDDPIPLGWTEGPPPLERKAGPPFVQPKRGGAPDGGVSAKLRKHVFPRSGERLTSEQIMVRTFRFFFSDEALDLIATATMSKATELIVDDGGATRPLLDSDSAGLRARARPRSQELADNPLGVAELLVYLGIWLVMGMHPRAHTRDYWLTDPPGYRLPLVADNMRRDRYEAITAMLSFMEVGDSRWPDDKLRKFREFNELLVANVRASYDVPSLAVPDETRIKSFSRYNTSAYPMLCKPIRMGVTVYSLVFENGILFNWLFHLGKDHAHATHGQPTDQSFLDETDEAQINYLSGIVLRLIRDDFNGSGAVLFLDKAFTSIKLLTHLEQMGVYATGMVRARRPKTSARPAAESWPFGAVSKEAEAEHPKGWLRRAHRELGENGCIMSAELWLDSRLVTMLSTAYLSEELESMPRWSRSARARVDVPCTIALKMYSQHMNYVDCANKQGAETNLRMKRCPKRYHRQYLFAFLLPFVGVGNVRACHEELHAAAAEAEKAKYAEFGYKRWFQLTLGSALIETGMQMLKDEIGTPRTRAATGKRPACAPARDGRPPRPPPSFSKTEVHTHVKLGQVRVVLEYDANRNASKYMPLQGVCRGCVARAEPGQRGGRGDARPTVDGMALSRICTACKECKVHLCSGCFNDPALWCHMSHKAVLPGTTTVVG